MVKIFFLILFFPLFAFSFLNTKSAALGGAGRASEEIFSAALLNPATLGFFNSAGGELYYFRGHVEDIAAKTYGVNFVDGTSSFPGGLAYEKHTLPMEASEFWKGSVAHKWGNSFSYGFSALYTKKKLSDKVKDFWNGSLGFYYKPFSSFHLALVVDDLFSQYADNNFDKKITARDITLGVHTQYENWVHFYLDVGRVTGDKKAPTHWHFGTEWLKNEFFSVRAGYSKEDDRGLYSLGLGLKTPQWSLNYSFQKGRKAGFTGAIHGIDITSSIW